ncbi:Fc receptor-like protein 5 isoform X4 [Simochromis diagramma]|uniref:Fc receptor-like protein 5 isoform X4 n=1 Tax=Simochromis diagramma TaxID=43689 RepID=UPI001A7E6D6F|nr:Fc receptor-like protein 5 isoform X4 [Simochromis diagramma]
MGATLLCELGLFLLCTLLCTGHAQDAVLTIQPSWSSFFTGEFVTFKCNMNKGKDSKLEYKINKNGREFIQYNTLKNYRLEIRSTGDSGEYQCSSRTKSSHKPKHSNTVSLTVLAHKPRATVKAGTTIIPVGGSVTLTCSVQSSDGWKYEWFRRTQTTSEGKIRDQQNRDIRVSQGGIYSCRGTRGNPAYYTDRSDDVTIEITSDQPKSQITSDMRNIPVGGNVTLTCSVNSSSSSGWKYYWYRDENSSEPLTTQDAVFYPNGQISVSQEGLYRCRGGRGNPVYYTEDSQSVRIDKKAVPEPERSSFLTRLIVGLLCGILLILLLLLLLLYVFKRSKDSFFVRTENTNQNEIQRQNSSPLQDDACFYESIKDCDDTQNAESGDFTYSLIELKNFTMKDDSQFYTQVYYN